MKFVVHPVCNYIALAVILFFLSCKKESRWGCFKSTGPVTTENRIIHAFSQIDLEDNINLVLIQDSAYGIKIEGGKNLLPNIKTEVENNTLYISNENKCNWIRSFKKEITVYATSKTISHIEYKGFGNVSSENAITGEKFFIEIKGGKGNVNLKLNVAQAHTILHTGTADITLSGNSQRSYVYCGDIGHIDARDLISPYCEAANIGTGNIYVFASEQLYATTEYIGHIYYTGNPTSTYFNRLGEGEIKPI